MIQIDCPRCQKRYRLDDKFAGRKVRCKKCSQMLKILDLPPTPHPTTQSNHSPPVAAPAMPIRTAEAVDAPIATAELVGQAVGPVAVGPVAVALAVNSASPTDAGAGQPNVTTQVLRGATPQLKYEISQRPDFSIVSITIPAGKQVFAEPSAMVSMTPSVHLEAGFKGGIGKTFGRLLGGESLIINTYTAKDGAGEVMFAGGAAGDVAYHRLNNRTLYLQRGAYMLNSDGVEVSGKWQGAKGFFSGEGLVLLKASGTGDLFFNSYGAIMPIDVKGDFMVDTGYIVAFEDTLQYRVTVLPGLRTAGKVKSFFFGGEGLVCQFEGTGRVWIQTRQVKSFLSYINPYRPVKSKN